MVVPGCRKEGPQLRRCIVCLHRFSAPPPPRPPVPCAVAFLGHPAAPASASLSNPFLGCLCVPPQTWRVSLFKLCLRE